MYSGSLVFAQIMGHLPWHVFNRCVSRYGGDRYVKAFSCADQYRCMAFAQLTYRSSLRDSIPFYLIFRVMCVLLLEK